MANRCGFLCLLVLDNQPPQSFDHLFNYFMSKGQDLRCSFFGRCYSSLLGTLFSSLQTILCLVMVKQEKVLQVLLREALVLVLNLYGSLFDFVLVNI